MRYFSWDIFDEIFFMKYFSWEIFHEISSMKYFSDWWDCHTAETDKTLDCPDCSECYDCSNCLYSPDHWQPLQIWLQFKLDGLAWPDWQTVQVVQNVPWFRLRRIPSASMDQHLNLFVQHFAGQGGGQGELKEWTFKIWKIKSF